MFPTCVIVQVEHNFGRVGHPFATRCANVAVLRVLDPHLNFGARRLRIHCKEILGQRHLSQRYLLQLCVC